MRPVTRLVSCIHRLAFARLDVKSESPAIPVWMEAERSKTAPVPIQLPTEIFSADILPFRPGTRSNVTC